MPKRKTADATPEPVVKAKPSKPASTHKRTTTKKAEPTPTTAVATSVAALKPPTHQDIALLAWSYFEHRGHQGGSPHEDWIRAERELTKFAQHR